MGGMKRGVEASKERSGLYRAGRALQVGVRAAHTGEIRAAFNLLRPLIEKGVQNWHSLSGQAHISQPWRPATYSR